jgi:N-acetylmuramoyl-L-alanine amidase
MITRGTCGAAALVALALLTAGCGPTGDHRAGARDTPPAAASTAPRAVPNTSGSPATATTPAVSTSPTTTAPRADGSIHPGDRGPQVQALQERLVAQGYWLGTADGTYGDLTQQAVYALQKAAGLSRDGVAGTTTLAALDRGVRPTARLPTGHHIEIDLTRQLLVVVDDGRVQTIFNTSTGSGHTYLQAGVRQLAVTPAGTYRVFRQVDGEDDGPLGALWRPKYFNGGIAIHGLGSVPPYPASHGCARVSDAAMNWIWATGALPIGTTVEVYA